MKISFLQAKHGDCIHISHNGRNIIIDSGTPKSDAFGNIMSDIKRRGQRIDLLVITHYDYDHIGGVSKMDVSNWKLIDKIWFNSANRVISVVNTDGYLSIKQANIVQRALESYGVNWDRTLTRGKTFDIGDGWMLKILYGGYDKTPNGTGEFLTTPKCDWNTTLEQLEPYLNDKVLDCSEVNASSIVLLLTNGVHSYLLAGDSTPEVLVDALCDYSMDNPLRLDLFKLPHHGSYKNITQEILKRIICSDYAVLTDGNVHYHPNKKMMLKILKWGRRTDVGIRFHLNYYMDLINSLKITNEEKDKFKFELDGNTEFEV